MLLRIVLIDPDILEALGCVNLMLNKEGLFYQVFAFGDC